mgnify:CR=1 FL=1|tara:strand:- start:1118 stop:1471 length:354 start_codon:yes stop_codon:yes gene_type:complete
MKPFQLNDKAGLGEGNPDLHSYAGVFLSRLVRRDWRPPNAEIFVDYKQMKSDTTMSAEGVILKFQGVDLCRCCRQRETMNLRNVCSECYKKAKLDRRFWKNPYQWVIDQRKEEPDEK